MNLHVVSRGGFIKRHMNQSIPGCCLFQSKLWAIGNSCGTIGILDLEFGTLSFEARIVFCRMYACLLPLGLRMC